MPGQVVEAQLEFQLSRIDVLQRSFQGLLRFHEKVQQQALVYTNLNPEAELEHFLVSVGVKSKIRED